MQENLPILPESSHLLKGKSATDSQELLDK